MPDEIISDLTPNPSIDGTEEIPTERSGVNLKNTYNALKTWLGISGTNTGDQDLSGLSGKATTQVTFSATAKTVATTDAETSHNLYGAGALSVWTLDVGSLTEGTGFEVNLGDADGVSFVAGAGANIFGAISGSTTLGDSVFVRRLADGIFGLTGEVYKVY